LPLSRKILLARLFTRMPMLGRLWARTAAVGESSGIPWTPMGKPLASSRVCLITTGGLHLKSDTPFDRKDRAGDATFREIPATATRADLAITHDYYDHGDADRDFNVVMPLDRVRELVSAGHLGGLTATHYSLMGHIDGPQFVKLEAETLPRLVAKIRAGSPDFVFLTPT
jgi:D-proline reductase (dithiol) PrdB